MTPELHEPQQDSYRHLLLDDAVGRQVHRTLAALLGGGAELTQSAAMSHLARELPDRLPAVYRLSLEQRVCSAIHRYRTHFQVPSWRFVGSEEIAEDSALDLVWMRPTRDIVADEIKSGAGAEQSLDVYERQCRGQLFAGVRAIPHFAGVRLVLLAPAKGYWFMRGEKESRPWSY